MHARKKLILATLGVFLAGLGGIGIHRAIVAPRPILFAAVDCPVIGADNAKIAMIVFEDLACSSCRRFTQEILPQIQAAYIERGIAKLVLIPVVLYRESKMMANAILEVHHQAPEKVFPFLHELILEFGDRNPSALDLIDLAMRIGNIYLVDFARNIETGRYNQELDGNLHLAKMAMKKNLKTPALFINGFAAPALSFESISMQIDRILHERQR